MKELPLYDVTAPIACSLQESEVPARLAFFERMREQFVRLGRVPNGLLITFPRENELEQELRQFTLDEKRCCRFWGFDLTLGSNAVILRWEAPPEAQGLIDRLEDFFEGDAAPPL